MLVGFTAFIISGFAAGRFRWPLLFVSLVGALLVFQVLQARSRLLVTREHVIVDNGARRFAVALAGVRRCDAGPRGLLICARQPVNPQVPPGCIPFRTTATHDGDRMAQQIAFAVRTGGLIHRRRRTVAANQIAAEITALAEVARDASRPPT